MASVLMSPLVFAAEAVATTAPTLLPIPETAIQNENLAILKKVFKDEYARHATEQRQALANTLLQQATLDKNQPPMRYVMLREATELAANSGDAPVACHAIDALAKAFTVDALELKIHALIQAAQSADAINQWEAIANTGLPLLDATIRSEQFALGQRLAQLIDVAALKGKHVEQITAVQARTAEFRALLSACTTAQSAATTLPQHPLDEPANLNVGIYTCFVRGDWSTGLLHLAQGNNETFKAVAVKELVVPNDPIRQLELADRWWEIGEGYKDWMQREIRNHAAAWYHTALKNLNGVTLARINTRIDISGAAATQPFEKTINLLPTVDTTRDVVAGTWKMTYGVLASDDTKHARIAFPYEPPEEYDFKVECVIAQKGGHLAVLLTQHGTAFDWAMGVSKVCRFEAVNKHIHAGNPTEVKFDVKVDHKYLVVLQVRKDGVKALVDGQLIGQYKTDYNDLSRYAQWKIPNDRTIGLGSSGGALLVYSAEVVEIGGEGKKTR